MDSKTFLHSLLIESAHQEGFPLANTIDIDLAFSDPNQTFQQHVSTYDQWIQTGKAGKMEYLVRGRDRRADPRLLFPNAQSILCVAIPYPRKPGGAIDPTQGPRYARYLQQEDYHLLLQERLERVMQQVREKWTQADQKNEPLEWKICVDTSAVLERTWAALAGLGWIGKDGLLIHPKLGSYLFLSEVLINHPTGKGPSPLPNYCGNCQRCLKQCPTQALIAPKTLDSNRCISYWTLEKRGALELPSEISQKIGPWIAGCDICQEVCPFNIKPSREEMNLDNQNPENFPPLATDLQTWRELLLETPEAYKLRVKTSAMNRIKPAQFSRNLAITLTNTLLALQKENLALFGEFSSALTPLIEFRFENEFDENAKTEWEKCINSIKIYIQ